MERANVERDLDAVSAHLARARDELALVNDQLTSISDEAHTARMRSLLSETPNSNLNYERAQKHIDALAEARASVAQTIDQLEAIRGDLLAQLLALDTDSNA